MNKLSIAVLLLCFYSATQAQTTVLSEDFETGLPSSWSLLNLDGFTPAEQVAEYTEAWIVAADITDSDNQTISSTSFFEPVGQANRWLISPPLVLGAFGNALSWKAQSHDPSYPDTYLVLASKTDANVESFVDTLGYVQQEDAEWVTRTVDLSANGFNGETIYLAFVNITDDGFKLYLDDILVTKDDPAAVYEVNAIDFSLFPNPSSDKINISSEVEIQTVHLKSLDGKSIRIYTHQEKVLDISYLEAGTYILELTSEKGVGVKKFIKK